MFEKYGIFNIVDQLSNGNILLWDKILNIECGTVLIKLKLEQDTTIYKSNLQKIQEDRIKAQRK